MLRLFAFLLLIPVLGCSSEAAAPAGTDGSGVSSPLKPQFTTGSGVTRTDLGQATFEIEKVNRVSQDWHLMLNARDGFELAVRTFSYAPSSETAVTSTGWHRHPGPVLIQVVKGTVNFYEADDPTCTAIVVDSGEAYLDLGEHAHIGRNETNLSAQDVTVLFGPPGIAPAEFRIDVSPAPGNCPF